MIVYQPSQILRAASPGNRRVRVVLYAVPLVDNDGMEPMPLDEWIEQVGTVEIEAVEG